jgi:hypothetical protein
MGLPEILFMQSDNLIEVSGVKNVATDAYLNSATVTVTLKDAGTDINLSGQSWPLTLSYVPESNGNYRGTITNDVLTTSGQRLKAAVSVDAGEGLSRYWEIPVVSVVG